MLSPSPSPEGEPRSNVQLPPAIVYPESLRYPQGKGLGGGEGFEGDGGENAGGNRGSDKMQPCSEGQKGG